MVWDYANDTVRVRYDRRYTSPLRLGKVISSCGFDVRETTDRPGPIPSFEPGLTVAPVPDDAPAFFRAAFERARVGRKPLVIDFWAEWCPACVRLKQVTLEHPTVAPLLKGVELVYVDLDKYPALGTVYGVAAIPDLFFVDLDGRIVDRLRTVESPERFRERLRTLLGEHPTGVTP